MEFDENKIDEAALAILSFTLHDYGRAWKQIDWEIMNRLHEKGFISNPVGKTKSVQLTESGIKEAEKLAIKLFGKDK